MHVIEPVLTVNWQCLLGSREALFVTQVSTIKHTCLQAGEVSSDISGLRCDNLLSHFPDDQLLRRILFCCVAVISLPSDFNLNPQGTIFFKKNT